MEQGELDWSAPDLLNALNADAINGFGFQCEMQQDTTHHKTRLYIGKIFLAEPDESKGYPYYEVNTEKILKEEVIPLLEGYSSTDIWCTDYIGHEFVTLWTGRYLDIPKVINSILSLNKYSFVTHNGNTSFKAMFRPGEVYSRKEHELKLIECLHENYIVMAPILQFSDPQADWNNIKVFGGIRQFTYPWNYATAEGRAFCTELRASLGKKPVPKRKPRMLWDSYAKTAERYKILHYGGWSAYDIDGMGLPEKKQNPNEIEEK
jgi:hypothetical protein